MKAKYTKQQIIESIKYWKKQLKTLDEMNYKNSIVNESYSIDDPYFRESGQYLYIAANPSFAGDIVKIGYSDGEDLCTHLTRYNTSVPDQFVPVAQIWFDGNADIRVLEKQFMKLFKNHDGNGGTEFFDSTVQNAKRQAQMFARRSGGLYHPF